MFTDDDIIHTYTRREAIADGVLVDVTGVAREAGFRIPVAITAGVMAEYLSDLSGEERDAKLSRFLSILSEIGRSNPDSSRVVVFVLNRDATPPKLLELIVSLGPDDNGDACITVMFPHED